MPARRERSGDRRSKSATPDAASVDQIDRALLTALQKDGRATVQSLAAELALSPATVSVRFQALKKRGLVSGVHARVNYTALGYVLCAFVLLRVNDITGQRGQLTDRFLALPEIEELAWITGDHDIVVKVWARDTRHLEAIVVRMDEIGARSQTLLVLGEPHQKPGVEFERPATQL